MNTDKYSWNHFLFIADILVQKGCLDEKQLIFLVDLVDIKKIVKYNKLSTDFINNYI